MKLYDGMWNEQRCFVVGGGPSLRGFDWSRLDGERVIAVNRAYQQLPRAVVCSMDLGFWREHGEAVAQLKHEHASLDMMSIRRSFPALHVRVGDEKLPARGPSQIVPCVANIELPNPHLEPVWGYSLQTGLGCGGNSGFTAVNLADVLGARVIYLLGFDMRVGPDGQQEWWHDGYDQPPQSGAVYARMISAFGRVRECIRARVINLNPDSALKVFPRLPMKGVI